MASAVLAEVATKLRETEERDRAAKLRMLRYLSQPTLPFFPDDSAA